jgi:DNA-binding beta-propeller fold protein YncE
MKTMNISLALILAAAALPAAAADISTSAVATPAVSTGTHELVWPQAPDKPRIRFVRTIKSADDLQTKEELKKAKEKKEGFLARLIAFFSGGKITPDIFNNPYGIWRQGDKLYVTDTGAQTLAVVDLKANTFTYMGDKGEDNLKSPVSVTADEAGNAYVSDTSEGAIKAYSPEGKLMWKSEGGIAGAGTLKRPAGIALTPSGDILVADSSNRRIVLLGKDGRFLREMCLHAKKEYFALPNPNNVWAFKNGDFMVSDPLAARVHIFSSTGAALGGFGEGGDAPGYMSRPRGIAADSDGNIHVVDALFSRVQVFDRQGQLLVWYGSPGEIAGQLALPAGIFIDKDDMIYVADTKNKRIEVYQYITYPEEKASAAPQEAK